MSIRAVAPARIRMKALTNHYSKMPIAGGGVVC